MIKISAATTTLAALPSLIGRPPGIGSARSSPTLIKL
jgi:hypothetical protein